MSTSTVTAAAPAAAPALATEDVARRCVPRTHVSLACERCRKYRRKCSAKYPCERCVRLGVECVRPRQSYFRKRKAKCNGVRKAVDEVTAVPKDEENELMAPPLEITAVGQGFNATERVCLSIFMRYTNSFVPFATVSMIQEGLQPGLLRDEREATLARQHACRAVVWAAVATGSCLQDGPFTAQYLEAARMHLRYCYDVPLLESVCALAVLTEALFFMEDTEKFPLYARFAAILYCEVKHLRPVELQATMLHLKFLMLQLPEEYQDLSLFPPDLFVTPQDMSNMSDQLRIFFSCPTTQGSPILHVTNLEVQDMSKLDELSRCMTQMYPVVFGSHNPVAQWYFLLHRLVLFVCSDMFPEVTIVLNDVISHLQKFPMLLPELRRRGTLNRLFDIVALLGDEPLRATLADSSRSSHSQQPCHEPTLTRDFVHSVICNLHNYVLRHATLHLPEFAAYYSDFNSVTGTDSQNEEYAWSTSSQNIETVQSSSPNQCQCFEPDVPAAIPWLPERFDEYLQDSAFYDQELLELEHLLSG